MMKSTKSTTAIFDIGKTNKKFFLFDEQFSVIHKTQIAIAQAEDEDGYPCENAELLSEWMQDRLSETLQNRDIEIKALNFSTYGATLVHLDEKGKLVTPIYDYLKPRPEKLFEDFFEKYGGKKELCIRTASPPLGMLNAGFQLYRLKYEQPEKFNNINFTLHLPQYASFLITGEYYTEHTSLGCHTAMWDFVTNDYHRWIREEGIESKLPDIKPITHTSEARWNGHVLKTGIGIHDSSAALAPYLYLLDEPFMLLSTGTWSIAFNSFNRQPLTFEELERDCLNYLNIHGEQVKASRFYMGNEHMHQKERLDQHFGERNIDKITPDGSIIKKLINRPENKLQLETAYNTGPFPQEKPGRWNLGGFESYEEAYHQLVLDLVAIQRQSIRLVEGTDEIDHLIVTGGFSRNKLYTTLLASFFPDKKIYTTNLPYASALGAALVVNGKKMDSGDKSNLKNLLRLNHCKGLESVDIQQYSWRNS